MAYSADGLQAKQVGMCAVHSIAIEVSELQQSFGGSAASRARVRGRGTSEIFQQIKVFRTKFDKKRIKEKAQKITSTPIQPRHNTRLYNAQYRYNIGPEHFWR